MAKTNAEIAIEHRTKFEFYLLALTFAILGLSIQTATFGERVVADILELAGWLGLFVAGIIGLLRSEWISVVYDIFHKIHTTEQRINQVIAANQAGVDFPLTVTENGEEHVLHGEEAVAKLQGIVAEFERQQRETEQKIRFRYNVTKWAFLIGVGCLLAARGIPPIMSIYDRLC